MSLNLFLQTLVNGTLLGFIYSALAMGLSLTMGVLGIINVSHSAFLIVATLLTASLVNVAGLDPFLATLVIVPVFFVLGSGIERTLIRRVAREAPTTALVVLFGVLVVIESLAILVWTTDTRVLALTYLEGSFELGTINIPIARVAAASLGLMGALGLYVFLERSTTGRGIRALGENPDVAAIVGIDVARLRTIVFGLGTALAALGGIALALAFPFTPQQHVQWLAWAFLIVILGGLGNVRNTVVAGLALGLIEAFAGVLFPFSYVLVIVYGLLAGALLVRSEGLLGTQERGL